MLLEFSHKEFGRIAGELLDPLLWFLMFALAVGTRRWLQPSRWPPWAM